MPRGAALLWFCRSKSGLNGLRALLPPPQHHQTHSSNRAANAEPRHTACVGRPRALSIWMNETDRYRYAALPIHSVSANRPPMGTTHLWQRGRAPAAGVERCMQLRATHAAPPAALLLLLPLPLLCQACCQQLAAPCCVGNAARARDAKPTRRRCLHTLMAPTSGMCLSAWRAPPPASA